MALHAFHGFGRERRSQRVAAIGLHVLAPTHAGDDGRDRRLAQDPVAQDELQRGVSQRVDPSTNQDIQRLRPPHRLPQPLALKVLPTPIASRKHRVLTKRAGQATLVEGAASDDPDTVLLRKREQPEGRALIEEVEDDLEGIDPSRPDQVERRVRLVVVQRHAQGADLPGQLEIMQRVDPLGLGEPGWGPDVELLKIEEVAVEVLQALLGAGDDPVPGKDLADRRVVPGGPLAVLRRDLGRDRDGAANAHFADRFGDQALAVAVAVRERRVEERDPELECFLQGRLRLGVVRFSPQTPADAPRAEPDLRDRKAGSPEGPRVDRHDPDPSITWLEADELEAFIKGVAENVLVVLDEAYYEYMPENLQPNTNQWLKIYPNLIVTRTFSKIYGLAGLRIGYAVSHPDIADVLGRVRQPFNTNLLAQAAALAALDDRGHLGRSVQMNTNGLNQLSDGFKHLDLQFITSIGNFMTVDMACDAAPVYEAMLREGVIVRPLASYNLKQHLRITVGSREQNDRCLKALEKVLHGKSQK